MDAVQTRLGGDVLATTDERGTTCCYAQQDKFWVEGTPDGERWEVYTVLADSPTAGGPAEGEACACDDVSTSQAAAACCT